MRMVIIALLQPMQINHKCKLDQTYIKQQGKRQLKITIKVMNYSGLIH